MKTAKIVLGTVQLGLKYGINNSLGKPSAINAFQILDLAQSLGVKEIDTADGYGDASEVLRDYFQKNPGSFKVMSKCSLSETQSFTSCFNASLDRLGLKYLEGYYFHKFSDFLGFKDFNEVQNLKLEGKLKKMAVSLYSEDELAFAVNHPEVDVIQLPFNLLDRSSKKIDLLKKAKELNKDVYVRSAFLQGLFFMHPSKLPAKLMPLGPALEQIRSLSEDFKIGLEEMCLNYVIHKDYIDKVVIGVETMPQLMANINSIRPSFSDELNGHIESIQVQNVELLNPGNWN